MSDKESPLILSEYQFLFSISKGSNLKTKFPCSYYLSVKNLTQPDPLEPVPANEPIQKHSPDEQGDVLFNIQLQLIAQIIYNPETEQHNQKKINIYLYYQSEEKPDKPRIAGVITLDLVGFIGKEGDEGRRKETESRIYNLEKTPLKQGTIQMSVTSRKIRNLELESFRETKSINNSLTSSIKSLGKQKDRVQKTTEQTRERSKQKVQKEIEKQIQRVWEQEKEHLQERRKSNNLIEEIVEVRRWTDEDNHHNNDNNININDSRSNLSSSRNTLSVDDNTRKYKRKIKELESDIKLMKDELEYQKLRNENVIKELQGTQMEMDAIVKNINEKEQEYDKTLMKSQDDLLEACEQLERQIKKRESVEIELQQMTEKLNNSKRMIEGQTQKIQLFEQSLQLSQNLQLQITRLQQQNQKLKQAQQSQPQTNNNNSYFLQTISKLQVEQMRIANRVQQQKSLNSKLKNQLTISQSQYLSIFQQNKYLLQTLQKLSIDLVNKQKQLGDVRIQYQAYRLHRHNRKEIKQNKEKLKMEEYERQQCALSMEIIRLNDELFGYREIEIQNSELKRQISCLLAEIEEFKVQSVRQRSVSAVSARSGEERDKVKQLEDRQYVHELNEIINESKLQQGKLNEKLVQFEKQNENLKRLIGNSIEIGMLEQVIKILKYKFTDKTHEELVELLKEVINKEVKMGWTEVMNVNEVIRGVLGELTNLKVIGAKELGLEKESGRKFLAEVIKMEQKLASVLNA